MTTIAYRDGVMAADTLATRNGNRAGTAIKIAKRGKLLAGASGSSDCCQAFRAWFMGGCIGHCPPMGDPEKSWAEGVIVMPDGALAVFGPSSSWLDRPYGGFWASGSGGDLALGAMAAGATAEEAVKAAAMLDINTGGDVTVLKVGG